MIYQSPSTANVSIAGLLRRAALAGLVLASQAGFAQAPGSATPAMQSAAAPASASSPAVDPVEAFSDPRWTGRPQAPAELRKEAAAAFVEGKRSCARERSAPARSECLGIVMADHRLMLDAIGRRGASR